MGIQIEKEESAPLAVIYGDGDLEAALNRILQKQHLRTLRIREKTDALSVLEKPNYIFFGSADRDQFREALESATKSKAKVVVILREERTFLIENSWPIVIAEIRGQTDGPSGEITENIASKLIRLGFSSHTASRQVFLAKESGKSRKPSDPQKLLSTQDVFNKLNSLQKKRKFSFKKFFGKLILTVSFFLILASIFLLFLPTVRAVMNLQKAQSNLVRGQFTAAQTAATQAKYDLETTKQTARVMGPLAEKYFDFLLLGQTSADIMIHAARIGPKMGSLTQDFSALTSLRGEIGPLKEELGLLEAQTKSLNINHEYLAEIPEVISALTQVDKFLTVWPEIVPANEKRTYLLVFQNSAELRPTGGFIGSYGLVHFDYGKLTSWKIYDIYSADGQLKGQIFPPDELLHYLGQPSWYMRDGNWAPDFPLTAKRLIWFLEKETGQKADGVIAVNLGAAQKLLAATGPLQLPDFSQTVSANDFFQKAEYSSEINFFAGSTQKKDFLGAVASAMLSKISSDSNKNWPLIGKALLSTLSEKDIMLYFNSPAVQDVASQSQWGGTITNCQTNCFMLVEANLGANKANYFVKREFSVASVIDKNGKIETTVSVHFRNDSPSLSWPGGIYKNYVRFLVPAGSQVVGFDIGDGRKPVVSPILVASELAKVESDQFFVFQTKESNFDSFGTIVQVPIQSELTLTFRYRPAVKVQFGTKTTYVFNFLKQPGTGPDPLDLTIDYPGFLSPETPMTLAIGDKLIYNSDTTTDRRFEVKFTNKL